MKCRVLALALAALISPLYACEANAAMPFAFISSFFNEAPKPAPAPAPDVLPDANLDDDKFDLTGAPGPLSDVPVPTPPDLSKYVKDINKARLLGKALFWDMQVGGDGRTACATCHFHAGVDARPRNTLSPKGPGTPVNKHLSRRELHTDS